MRQREMEFIPPSYNCAPLADNHYYQEPTTTPPPPVRKQMAKKTCQSSSSERRPCAPVPVRAQMYMAALTMLTTVKAEPEEEQPMPRQPCTSSRKRIGDTPPIFSFPVQPVKSEPDSNVHSPRPRAAKRPRVVYNEIDNFTLASLLDDAEAENQRCVAMIKEAQEDAEQNKAWAQEWRRMHNRVFRINELNRNRLRDNHTRLTELRTEVLVQNDLIDTLETEQLFRKQVLDDQQTDIRQYRERLTTLRKERDDAMDRTNIARAESREARNRIQRDARRIRLLRGQLDNSQVFHKLAENKITKLIADSVKEMGFTHQLGKLLDERNEELDNSKLKISSLEKEVKTSSDIRKLYNIALEQGIKDNDMLKIELDKIRIERDTIKDAYEKHLVGI